MLALMFVGVLRAMRIRGDHSLLLLAGHYHCQRASSLDLDAERRRHARVQGYGIRDVIAQMTFIHG